MEKTCLSGLFLCCAWNPKNEESTRKEVGEGRDSNREINSYKVEVAGNCRQALLTDNFSWSLLIMHSTRKRQDFPASHPWVQIPPLSNTSRVAVGKLLNSS